MKSKYNAPDFEVKLIPRVDVLNASDGGTFGTIGDYDGDFLE